MPLGQHLQRMAAYSRLMARELAGRSPLAAEITNLLAELDRSPASS